MRTRMMKEDRRHTNAHTMKESKDANKGRKVRNKARRDLQRPPLDIEEGEQSTMGARQFLFQNFFLIFVVSLTTAV